MTPEVLGDRCLFLGAITVQSTQKFELSSLPDLHGTLALTYRRSRGFGSSNLRHQLRRCGTCVPVRGAESIMLVRFGLAQLGLRDYA